MPRTNDHSSQVYTGPSYLHLSRAGTSVVIDVTSEFQPIITYWGKELGVLEESDIESLCRAQVPQRVSSGIDIPPRTTLIPQEAGGWSGTPGLTGHHDNGGFATKLALRTCASTSSSATFTLGDDEAHLNMVHTIVIDEAGLVHTWLEVTNLNTADYTLTDLHITLPLPSNYSQILTTTGHHLRERTPQRQRITVGTYLRESRRGRPGADSTLFVAAGEEGFGFEKGRVHVVHLAWSGNQRLGVEQLPSGHCHFIAGEVLQPGEMVLASGQRYRTPPVIASWGNGLSEASCRYHRMMRARPQHPKRPRPVTLNTWEAVYFDHNLERLQALADKAAQVGVERFVLDDGWFHLRRDDTAGLGDWVVDEDVWPDGLHPLIDHVRSLGMEFGLWVEPEMVNLNSDVARRHPEWILHGRNELPRPARGQQVLNLANEGAYEHIYGQLSALLREYPISYLKWDHNRDLLEAASGPGGRALNHANVEAVYSLMDRLKAEHPGLEIESCASGGFRVDLGILQRTDRIWVSDCLDPLERLTSQKYTGVVVPPEMMGQHLTSPVVHSTGRTTDLVLSAGVALFGHLGVEWDLTSADEDTLRTVARIVEFHKSIRDVIAHGSVIHTDLPDPALDVRGIVSEDQTRAYITITQVTTSDFSPCPPVRIPGLDPTKRYEVTAILPSDTGEGPGQSDLEWVHAPTVLTGRILAEVGLMPPVQHPGHLTLVELKECERNRHVSAE